ncbi:MAG: hypothetical protein N3C60_00725 [Calditerrivibrio sp.]|nr:hypothetical protein [Calditerrivibrio sp.]
MFNLLFVEDEDIFYTIMEMLSKKFYFNLFIAKTVSEAKKILDNNKIDVAIIDYELPDGKGDEISDYIAIYHNDIITAISSGHGGTIISSKSKYKYVVDKSDLISFIREIAAKVNETKS